MGRRRGKVVIEFGSVDDLERIVGMLGVPPGAAATVDSDSGTAHREAESHDGGHREHEQWSEHHGE
jgi:hypothetical protein